MELNNVRLIAASPTTFSDLTRMTLLLHVSFGRLPEEAIVFTPNRPEIH
jgi:hypothetical protein